MKPPSRLLSVDTIETVEPSNDRSLESWTDCPAFEAHVEKTLGSAKFKEAQQQAAPFFRDVRDYVFGRPTSIENAYNLWDYMSSELVHNKTFAHRLPPTFIEQARGWADFRENAIFSDGSMAGIGNIASRTALQSIISALQRIAFNGDPLQFMLIETTYQPFISLFHQTEMIQGHPELQAIPDFGSALAIELRRSPPDSREFLRFKFRNGTNEDFQTVHVFGHREDIALTEFIYRLEGSLIHSNKEWARVCGISSEESLPNAASISGKFLEATTCMGLVFFVMLLASVVSYGVRSYRRRNYIRLQEEEDGIQSVGYATQNEKAEPALSPSLICHSGVKAPPQTPLEPHGLPNVLRPSSTLVHTSHKLRAQICNARNSAHVHDIKESLAKMYILETPHWQYATNSLLELLSDMMRRAVLCLTAFLASTGLVSKSGTADVTGPIVETNMMGYAYLPQTDIGLHMRQRSRAFIVADASNPTNRIVFINSDICMGDTGVRRSIVEQLSSQYPGLYTNDNIALVGTHQHSGVGGYLEDLLPQLTSLGYVKDTADAIVAGTVLAVQRAHNSLQPGNLSLGNTTILDASINRSPYSYLANPAEERARYEYNTDKAMTLLRFDDNDGNARGFLSFFAVHGTSLYENNTLISSDNKGMAAYIYEAMVEPDAMPGNATFVAGFTQSNVGDSTPNTLGAFCESPGEPYDGQPCDFEHSTCGNRTEDCHGRGPGFTISDFASNEIIAQKQVDGAQSLMNQTLAPVQGPVKFVHTYMNMSFRSFELPNGTTVQTCPPALGFSFAGGTTDGPGAFDFIQGDNTSDTQNPFWELVKGAVTPDPSPEQAACHYPKPILLNTGYANTPYQWSPHTVDVQMLRVGNLVMLIMPGELTTMSGRRLREAVRAELIASGVLGDDAYVVIAGPANTYGHYVATPEEYTVQRYEGASTLFGPHTLDSYIQKYTSLVSYLNPSITSEPASDPAPEDQTTKAISLQTPVIFDNAPLGSSFGSVQTDVLKTPYSAGDSVSAVFVGADPRNNLRLEETFLTVDSLVNNQWIVVRTDSHPSTVFRWTRTSTILGYSTVNITWTIEDGTPAGTYRLTYYGDAKDLLGTISDFTGHSSSFTVA
ncbi:hypothetical protein NM688_g75 [Phlebia brevispora]|uniref:Uncharacterized protein n=1 Tax=Phlebia brevispora TaxID=194682 RepID=A0ACC1TF81_9APHY|nr:hypothetical protein NM688_g75 [Phlebia brevispora]